MSDRNEPEDKKEKAWYADALLLFSRLTIWIAVPVVVAVHLGKYLDERFGTKPWIVTVCLIISFNLSIIVLLRETKRVFKDLDKK